MLNWQAGHLLLPAATLPPSRDSLPTNEAKAQDGRAEPGREPDTKSPNPEIPETRATLDVWVI